MNYFILQFSWICHHVKNSLMYVIPSIANCHHLKNPKKIFNEYIYIVRGVIQCTESKYVLRNFYCMFIFSVIGCYILAISLRLKFVHIFHQVTITPCPNETIHLHQVYFNVLSLHILTIFKFEP